MATEPITIDQPADVSASLSASLSIDDSKNVASESPAVNGAPASNELENKLVTNVEERSASADPSVSGTSDNESRADGAKDKDGDKGHARVSSTVKKPAFKSVSVNKKFLASKPGSTGPSPTPSDKGVGSTKTPPPGTGMLSSRPRLVAKVGSGTGSSLQRTGANGGKAPAAPDASAVWNRNRAPSPKKYTDEELKKYGIHMASRLKEDETSGKNQWADIDDDDDDWAPETMTWSDGTKTSLPHPDEQPVAPSPLATSAPLAAAPLPSKPDDKPAPPTPVTLADITPSKSTNLASGKGFVLKPGAQEKHQPTLVAKPPPPPATVKSPWATLPPVERASPAAYEAQPVQRGPSSNYREMPSHSTREIAADDFSRSPYRDGHPQQLFNSQSGQYEPVRERRGSVRHEGQGRHPSLLQRHPPGDHPAEPSSAFQTHRASQDHSFGRRRASSNLSGEGRDYMPRMARPNDGHMPPPEALNARRSSQAGSVTSPVSPMVQPAGPHGQQRGPQPPGYQQAPPSAPYGGSPQPMAPPVQQQAPVNSIQDDVEMQQKLMRERIEQAKKRRQEEEAREEAERKERIRKKLESLGPAPEKKSDKKEAPAKPEIIRPTQIAQREHKDPTEEVVRAIHELHQSHPEQDAPTPEPSGPKGRRLSSNNAGGPPSSQRRASHGPDAKRPEPWIGSGPRPEKYNTPWAPPGPPPGASAVWGNTRGLGNGTFGTELGHPSGSQPGPGQAPIGPPGAAARPPPGPIGSRAGGYAQRPIGGGSELASKWVSQVEENDKMISAEKSAERQRREANLAERSMSMEEAQPKIKDTWRPTHVVEGGRRVGSSSLDGVPQPPPTNPAGVIGSSIVPSSAQSTPSQGRQSRFFPTMESPDHYTYGRSSSPSPPPPMMEGHPAYEGDAMHPHVLLPRSRPIVKLPPSQQPVVPDRQAPRSFSWANPPHFAGRPMSHAAVAAMPPPIGTQAGVQSQAQWQNKFNTLFHPGNNGSPPKSLGIDPASRNAYDHSLYHKAATVSFPGKPAVAISAFTSSATTKSMAEECFEEQEMGSLPQIRIPRMAPEFAWPPAPEQTKPFPKKFLIQPTARDSYRFFPITAEPGHIKIEIRIPYATEVRAVSIDSSIIRGTRGGRARGGPRHRGSGRGGARESTGSSPRAEGEAPPTERDPPAERGGRRGRGGYRGRGGFNSRSASSGQTPIAT